MAPKGGSAASGSCHCEAGGIDWTDRSRREHLVKRRWRSVDAFVIGRPH